jgi:hypothetical protein
MNRLDQATLVASLMDSIKTTITQKIMEGEVPIEWDGIELRRYVADKVTELSGCDHIARDKARLRAYKNELLVRNL